MKKEKKTWKEIEKAIPGKDNHALRMKYKELCAAAGEGNKTCDSDSKGKEKGKQKGGKGKEKEGAQASGEEPKTIDGRPVIYLSDDDELSAIDVSAFSV